MTEQEYLTQRVDDQINWYDRKSMMRRAALQGRVLRRIALPRGSSLSACSIGSWRHWTCSMSGQRRTNCVNWMPN